MGVIKDSINKGFTVGDVTTTDFDDEAKIKVNGVLLPTPSDISVEIQDLDGDSVRPIATGVLRRNRIRSNIRIFFSPSQYLYMIKFIFYFIFW